MKKNNILTPCCILLALASIGCTNEHEIDGEYVVDIEYSAQLFAQSSDLKYGMDSHILLDKVIDTMPLRQTRVLIDYPTFSKTMINRGRTQPTTETHQLKQLSETEFLLIFEHREGDRSYPLYFDPVTQTVLFENYRYIRKTPN